MFSWKTLYLVFYLLSSSPPLKMKMKMKNNILYVVVVDLSALAVRSTYLTYTILMIRKQKQNLCVRVCACLQ